MFVILAVFIFLLGIIIGSFLNVVILRYNTGMPIAADRSRCFSCGHSLGTLELIPVLSYVIQRGRCKHCGAKISWQYPFVELLTGFLFLAVFLGFPIGPILAGIVPQALLLRLIFTLIYYYVIISILIVIMVYDLRHKIIPDGLVYTFIALSLVYKLILIAELPIYSRALWLDLAAGPIFFVIFFLIWYLSRGRAMGFGDAKLVLGIGFFLGLVQGTSALILGFWIGAVVGIALLLFPYMQKKLFPKASLWGGGKGLTIKSELPFAPFLILGLLIAFFFPIDILHLAVLLSL